MITTVNNENKDVVVAFHVGRGGHFNNQGHKSFLPSVSKLQDCFGENSFINDEYEDGTKLPDEQWQLIDGGSNVILEGREAIESQTGVLDWDGEYNTDIVRYIEDCTDAEMEILYKAYIDGDLTDDDAINYVCEWKGVKRISSVKFFQMNATVFFTDHTSLEYTWDGEEDVDAEDIKEWMEENDIDAKSIEDNAYDFEDHFYNN